MASIYVECPSCNTEARIEDSLLGSRIACGKCATGFVAEVGGTYDIEVIEPAFTPRIRTAPGSPTRPGAPKPSPKPKAADPALDKLMERWAEE